MADNRSLKKIITIVIATGLCAAMTVLTSLAVILEVRWVRHEISRRYDHEVHQVVASYRAFQDELKRSRKYRFA